MKEIFAFAVRDNLIDNQANAIAPVFEISDICLTFAKEKATHTSSTDRSSSLIVFKTNDGQLLTQAETDLGCGLLSEVTQFLATTSQTAPLVLGGSFTAYYNAKYPAKQLTQLSFSDIRTSGTVKAPEYIVATFGDTLKFFIWTSNRAFRSMYPFYQIDIVLPVDNFKEKLINGTSFNAEISTFEFPAFINKMETAKGDNIETAARVLNIPYYAPGATTGNPCYFGFIVYGEQGDYEFLFRLNLYDYLISLGISSQLILSSFPDLLKVNEFFITPRWDLQAIPSRVGEGVINSQLTNTFASNFDIAKFIPRYADLTALKAATSNVPVEYNNLLLLITDGEFSTANLKAFRSYFSDFISISSQHPDFSRMSSRTQQFAIFLEYALRVANTSSYSEMLEVMGNIASYAFRTITREGVTYVSAFLDKHQFYILPKHEFLRLTS